MMLFDDYLMDASNSHRLLADTHPPPADVAVSTSGGGGVESSSSPAGGGGGSGSTSSSSSSSSSSGSGGSGGSGNGSETANDGGSTSTVGGSSYSENGSSTTSTTTSSSSTAAAVSSAEGQNGNGSEGSNFLKNGTQNQGLSGWGLAAVIAAAVLALLLLALLIFVMVRRHKKKKNRAGDERLLQKVENKQAVLQQDCELATVASSIPPSYEDPTSGLYRSLEEPETELDLSFRVRNTTNDEKYYRLSGTGFQKCDQDSHVGFVRITIVDGFASRDGSKACWIEERRPFIDNLHTRGDICPRPRCVRKNNCCSVQGVPALETTFSIDGEAVHRVECHGSFDYESNTFQGQWAQLQKSHPKVHSLPNQQTGEYKLHLNAPHNADEMVTTSGSDEATKEPRFQRLKKGVLSLFRKD